MIARVWEGKTKIEHSETYQKIIEERDIPDYKGTDGFIKLTFLKYSNQDHIQGLYEDTLPQTL